MKVKVRRAKDLPVVTRIMVPGLEREFPEDEQEFTLDVNELPFVLHDGNMEFVAYIEEEGDDDATKERYRNLRKG